MELSATEFRLKEVLFRQMGFKDYFQVHRQVPQSGPTVRDRDPPFSSPNVMENALELHNPPRLSGNSSQISGTMDDIKHEVMVNYLYQQQCSRIWVSSMQAYRRTNTPMPTSNYPRTPNGEGPFEPLTGLEQEGVLLRKSRGNYITCPTHLIGTPLEMACRALNVTVRFSPL